MTPIPEGFAFSQSCLQAYQDCKRRFELQYLKQVAWPALTAQPALEFERTERLGKVFHSIAQQYLLGLPPERLAARAAADPCGGEELERWWQNFSASIPDLPLPAGEAGPIRKLPEVRLVCPADFGDGGCFPYRMTATYDTLAVIDTAGGRRASILDWKTSKRKPRRERLREMLQTRVYRYLMVKAGGQFNRGVPFKPEQVEMIYWYTEAPGEPEKFPYSEEQYREDTVLLADTIADIERRASANDFPPGEDRTCPHCGYRSFCDRGVEAGTLEEAGEVELDFEEIEEI